LKRSLIGGVTVSALAIGPTVRRFKHDRGERFLRKIKILSTLSFKGKVKPEAPCRNILRHVKCHLQVGIKILRKAKFSFISPIPPACYQMTTARVATELWWMNHDFSSVDIIIPPRFSTLIWPIIWGINNRPVAAVQRHCLNAST
jgi:hypothetical protein